MEHQGFWLLCIRMAFQSGPVRSGQASSTWNGEGGVAVVIRLSEEDEALRNGVSYSHLDQADAGLGDVPPVLSALLPSFAVALAASA
jgi:hypothetical protein